MDSHHPYWDDVKVEYNKPIVVKADDEQIKMLRETVNKKGTTKCYK